MSGIPFYIGNFLACFVPDSNRRSRFRGNVNIALYRPRIMAFIKSAFGERVKNIKFIRQRTLNRMVCLVNDEYYVKIFRNVTVQQLKNYKFLLDFIRPHISVEIPFIMVDNHIPMYACKKMMGRKIDDFDKSVVLKNEAKIKRQVAKIINELQSVTLTSVPNAERFTFSMQPERTKEKPCVAVHPVLAHFDMNETNFLFDDDLNIIGVLDWDTLSVAQNPETDNNIFMKYWNKYKNGD